MRKRWILTLGVLVGLVMAVPAQGPPTQPPGMIFSSKELLIFRCILEEIDPVNWQVGFGVGRCREIGFSGTRGIYNGYFRFHSAASPFVCEIPFTYYSVAQIPAIPPDRFRQGLRGSFLTTNSGIAIQSELCLDFMRHVLDPLPARLLRPLDSGLALVGFCCEEVGSRTKWTIDVGTDRGVRLYSITVSAEVLTGGGFGRLEWN